MARRRLWHFADAGAVAAILSLTLAGCSDAPTALNSGTGSLPPPPPPAQHE